VVGDASVSLLVAAPVVAFALIGSTTSALSSWVGVVNACRIAMTALAAGLLLRVFAPT
jgi:cyanate permease